MISGALRSQDTDREIEELKEDKEPKGDVGLPVSLKHGMVMGHGLEI